MYLLLIPNTPASFVIHIGSTNYISGNHRRILFHSLEYSLFQPRRGGSATVEHHRQTCWQCMYSSSRPAAKSWQREWAKVYSGVGDALNTAEEEPSLAPSLPV